MISPSGKTTFKKPSLIRVKESVKVIVDISKRRDKHIECSPSRTKKEKEVVQGTMKALKEWSSNPWDPGVTALRSLESGKLSLKELPEDFNTAKDESSKSISSFKKDCCLMERKVITALPSTNAKIFLNHCKEIFRQTK